MLMDELSKELADIEFVLNVHKDLLRYHEEHKDIEGYEAGLRCIERINKQKEELLKKNNIKDFVSHDGTNAL